MGEYISREWLRKWAEEVCEWWGGEAEVEGHTVLRMPEEAPAADAVEVVRCKDCKHRIDNKEFVRGHYCKKRPSNGGYFCEDNDFCSYGERKEE